MSDTHDAFAEVRRRLAALREQIDRMLDDDLLGERTTTGYAWCLTHIETLLDADYECAIDRGEL